MSYIEWANSFQILRERVHRVREWIANALSPGGGIVSVNLETLGCAFAGYVEKMKSQRWFTLTVPQEFQSRSNALRGRFSIRSIVI
jgi:hypothetical protein